MRQALIVAAALGVCLATPDSSITAQSADSSAGTWRLNVAKSTYSPGPAPKSSTSVIEVMQNGMRRAVQDTVDAKGTTAHTEIVSMYDGKEYELKGAATPTTRAYKRIDGSTYEFVTRVNGKVTTTTRVVVAPGGKTRMITTTGTDAQGR
jgi:hypothetical protein